MQIEVEKGHGSLALPLHPRFYQFIVIQIEVMANQVHSRVDFPL